MTAPERHLRQCAQVQRLQALWGAGDGAAISWPGRPPVTRAELVEMAAQVPCWPAGHPQAGQPVVGQWFVIAVQLEGRSPVPRRWVGRL